MAMTNKLRLTNFYNFFGNTNDISLYEIEVYERGTKKTITSITAYNSIPANVSALTTTGNTTLVYITSAAYNTGRGSFFVELSLDSNISTEAFVSVRLKSNIYIGWPEKFDIFYYNGSGYTYYKTQKNPKYPGDNTFTSTPITSNGYNNKASRWDTVNHNNNIYVDPSGLNFNKLNDQPSSIRTISALTSGKYYFEVYEDGTSYQSYHSGSFGLCNSLFDTNSNVCLGADTAGNSYGWSYNALVYKASGDSDDIKNDIDPFGLSRTRIISPFWTSTTTKNFAVLIDLDIRLVTFKHLHSNSSVQCKIPWSGPIYVCYGRGTTGYNTALGKVNFGYSPFIGTPPKDYQNGYSVETIDITNFFTYEDYKTSQVGQSSQLKASGANPVSILAKAEAKLLNVPTINIDKATDDEILTFSKPLVYVNSSPTSSMRQGFGGFGYIKSNILKGTTILTPIKTEVVLLDIETSLVVESTYSDANTGEFEFKFLSEWRYYNILAFDPDRGWVTAIGGPFKPTRMPNTDGMNYQLT